MATYSEGEARKLTVGWLWGIPGEIKDQELTAKSSVSPHQNIKESAGERQRVHAESMKEWVKKSPQAMANSRGFLKM